MILLFISGWTSRVYSHLGLAPNFSRAEFLHLKILTAWSLKWQNVGFVHFWWLFAGRRKSWKSKATPKMPTTPPRKECLIKGSLTTITPYNNPLLVPYFLGGGYPKIPMIIYFKWVCRISVKWPFCMAQLWTVGTVSSLTFLGPEDKSKQWFGWCSESYFLKNTELHLQHIVWYDSMFDAWFNISCVVLKISVFGTLLRATGRKTFKNETLPFRFPKRNDVQRLAKKTTL